MCLTHAAGSHGQRNSKAAKRRRRRRRSRGGGGKRKMTYRRQGFPVRGTANFSSETVETRRWWDGTFKVWEGRLWPSSPVRRPAFCLCASDAPGTPLRRITQYSLLGGWSSSLRIMSSGSPREREGCFEISYEIQVKQLRWCLAGELCMKHYC